MADVDVSHIISEGACANCPNQPGTCPCSCPTCLDLRPAPARSEEDREDG